MERRDRWNRRIFYAVLLLVFVSMLVLNFLSPLESDDYLYMYSFANGERIDSLSSWIQSAVAHYHAMNGRIITNGVFSPLMAWAGKTAFNVLNSMVYVLFLLGLYQLARRDRPLDWKLLVALHSAVFLFAPVFGATVLWMIGACNFLWGSTLILYALLPFGRAVLGEEYRPRPLTQAGLFLLALLAGNVTENTSFAMIALMAGCLIHQWIVKKKIPLWMGGMLAAAAAGYAALMLSHETLSRIGHSGSMGGLLENFQDCMAKLKEQGFLIGAYVFLALLAGRGPRHRWRLRFSLGLFGSAMLANAMMISPGYYADRPAFGWVMMLIVACAILAPALAEIRELPLWNAAVVCLALSAVVTYLWALPACYNRYRQAEARVAYVEQQRDAGVTDVVAFSIKSHSRYDVYCDGNLFSAIANYGPNVCFAKRVGIESFAVSMEIY